MHNRFLCFALSVLLILGGCEYISPSADEIPPSASPEPSLSTSPSPVAPSPEVTPAVSDTPETVPGIYVNNERLQSAFTTELDQTLYVPLLTVIQALRPDAVVTEGDLQTEVTADGLTLTVYHQLNYLVANDRYLYLPSGVLTEDGQIMLPAKTLAQVLDAQLQIKNSSVCFTSGSGAIIPGSQYYDPDELFWLSHLIHAECGNQSLFGKIAVGNVVLNRVASPNFPNSIYDVIFQPGQFYDSYSGTITLEPNYESVVAAKLCLDGATVLSEAYWFNGTGIACWASQNKALIATIGGHSFYG